MMMLRTLFPLVAGLDNGLGDTPLLWWSSWNYFGRNVSEQLILQMAQALVDTGLAKLGYRTVSIDGDYLLHERDPSSGRLQVDPAKFPRGIRPIADALHEMGLKLGAYTDVSGKSCCTGPGSLKHYRQDASTFAADWQIDFLKVDFCGAYGGAGSVSVEPVAQFAAFAALRDELNATGRPIWLYLCPHRPGMGYHGLSYAPPAEWTATQRHALANSLLVEYKNIYDEWSTGAPGPRGSAGLITNIDALLQLTSLGYSARGSWNDGDMLVTCNFGRGQIPGAGRTLNEYRVQYAVWSILASPLGLSADLRNLKAQHPQCLQLLLNEDIVDVNQDAAARPPRLLYQKPPANASFLAVREQAFARPLSGGRVALLMLNRGDETITMRVGWALLPEIGAGARLLVRDAIAQRDAGELIAHQGGTFNATVASHDVSFVVFRPATRR